MTAQTIRLDRREDLKVVFTNSMSTWYARPIQLEEVHWERKKKQLLYNSTQSTWLPMLDYSWEEPNYVYTSGGQWDKAMMMSGEASTGKKSLFANQQGADSKILLSAICWGRYNSCVHSWHDTDVLVQLLHYCESIHAQEIVMLTGH